MVDCRRPARACEPAGLVAAGAVPAAAERDVPAVPGPDGIRHRRCRRAEGRRRLPGMVPPHSSLTFQTALRLTTRSGKARQAQSRRPAPVHSLETRHPGGGTGLGRALLLNASFEPLCVVPARRAVVLVLKEKAEILHCNGAGIRSERMVLPVPAVIRLRRYVRVPYRTRVPLSRRAVFARDGHRCQYCNHAAENIDHVIPRSRGGKHVWENVVASCRSCNAHKRDHLLDETGLRLRRLPLAPRSTTWIAATAGSVDPEWEPYLQSGGGIAS